MKKKITIFDVEIDGFGAKAAMQAAMSYMESESINAIEIVTLDMLMKGKDNPVWKENAKALDMLLPGEKEILEAAKVEDRGLLKDVDDQIFLKMFLKYLQRNRKRIFLLARTEPELYQLKEAMETYNRGICIQGSGFLDAQVTSEEDVINDVNGAEIDCVLSALPSPAQEDFIARNRALLNARLWLGCGMALEQRYNEKGGGVRRFFVKKMFRYRVGKQKKEN